MQGFNVLQLAKFSKRTYVSVKECRLRFLTVNRQVADTLARWQKVPGGGSPSLRFSFA